MASSSLEEMLESLRQRQEKRKELPPALPARPNSRARLPSARRSLPVNFGLILDAGDSKEEMKENTEEKEMAFKDNSFGRENVKSDQLGVANDVLNSEEPARLSLPDNFKVSEDAVGKEEVKDKFAERELTFRIVNFGEECNKLEQLGELPNNPDDVVFEQSSCVGGVTSSASGSVGSSQREERAGDTGGRGLQRLRWWKKGGDRRRWWERYQRLWRILFTKRIRQL
ncbi:hypothetical protein Ancab_000109 [Ancistrocladus abbreviatus]